MSDNSAIEWCDASWNPVTGCTKVSDGCTHCYIDRTPPFRMAGRRFNGDHTGATTGVKLHSDRLGQPMHWRKPRRVFVCSLADLFQDEVPDRFIADVFAVMSIAAQHTFQVLTKRHARMRSLLRSEQFWTLVDDARAVRRHGPLPGAGWVALPNVWIGVSVENQRWADIRVPVLLDTPAAVRWLSCEPLLGPVDLSRWMIYGCPQCDRYAPWTDGRSVRAGDEIDEYWCQTCGAEVPLDACEPPGIRWLIAGGESGPGARPMHPDWARQLRGQCTAAGVPFFYKQAGEWAHLARRFAADRNERGPWDTYVNRDGTVGQIAISEDGYATNWTGSPAEGWAAVTRVGKKAAGRTLDGRTWDEYPTPTKATC